MDIVIVTPTSSMNTIFFKFCVPLWKVNDRKGHKLDNFSFPKENKSSSQEQITGMRRQDFTGYTQYHNTVSKFIIFIVRILQSQAN